MKKFLFFLMVIVVSACEFQGHIYVDECWSSIDCGNGFACYSGQCYEGWDFCLYYECGYSSEYYYEEEYYYEHSYTTSYYEDECEDLFGYGWYTCQGDYCCY